MQLTGHSFINGQWVPGDGAPLTSTDPATNETVLVLHAVSPDQVNKALQTAREAFHQWKRVPFDERAAILRRFAALVEAQATPLATLIAQEMGKPLWDARTEVTAMQRKSDLAIQAYQERCPTKEHPLPDGSTLAIGHKPHGVVAVLGPFNFPGHLPNGQIAPALLAGNVVLFKPSEQTPAVGEYMVRLWHEAGLPPNALQLLQGGREVGAALIHHPELDGLFFTGSAATGRLIAEASLPYPRRIVALEMGGNNPLIVSKVDDVAWAAKTTIQSAFLSSGQRCGCARRLLLVDSPGAAAYLEALVQQTQALRVGPYTDTPEPYMGALVSEEASTHMWRGYQELIAQGAKPLLAMEQRGAFVTPAIVDVTGLQVADRELFGPLLQLTRVATLAEAIACANATQFGLTAGILTTDEAEFRAVEDKVRAGVINWNTPLTGASSMAPFGGCGASGNHRPAGYYAADFCAYPVAGTRATAPERTESPSAP